MWENILKQFEILSTRYDMSHASTELLIILGGSFLLGFAFCYVQSKTKS